MPAPFRPIFALALLFTATLPAIEARAAGKYGDYNGDGTADFAVYDQTAAVFYVAYSPTGNGGGASVQVGNPQTPYYNRLPLVGDYDGDGKTDYAVYDLTNATFSLVYARGGGTSLQWGNPQHGISPLVGDYDGDGRTDFAIYDSTALTYYVYYSNGNGGRTVAMTSPGAFSMPLVGDYDGDGKTDFTLFSSPGKLGGTGKFSIVFSTPRANFLSAITNAGPNDLVTAYVGQFFTSGVACPAIFNYSTLLFTEKPVSLSNILYCSYQVNFSTPPTNMRPVSGDYNGDGYTDYCVYDFDNFTFYYTYNPSNFSSSVGYTFFPNTYNQPSTVVKPLVGDYNNDGKTDFAIFNTYTKEFYCTYAGSNGAVAEHFYWGDPSHSHIAVLDGSNGYGFPIAP